MEIIVTRLVLVSLLVSACATAPATTPPLAPPSAANAAERHREVQWFRTAADARVGLDRGDWELALYVDNLTDERAFLALDRERGALARVGCLANQPRTVGLSLRSAAEPVPACSGLALPPAGP